ncbi:MAG: (2Fe-2S)-binding protein [Bacilli bacterium]|nr:(2Fe-2S)-binding protein [Bacilli bacterium]
MAKIDFVLNGKKTVADCHPAMRLLDYLRTEAKLTGVKEGCGEGECGACSVLLDHKVANSCMVPMANVMGKEVITIEGFRDTQKFKVLEKAFQEAGAVQCGICTPGMIIASESLLNVNPHPTDDEIRIALSGNLCRCTGYNMIVEAVLQAAREGEGLW